MHLDDYAIGKGNRQTGKQVPVVTERYVQNTVYWTDLNESYISLGGHQLSVDRTAHAAVELAEVVERVRDRCQRLAMERWGAALNELTTPLGDQGATDVDAPGRGSRRSHEKPHTSPQ
jgi:hypothetical protein